MGSVIGTRRKRQRPTIFIMWICILAHIMVLLCKTIEIEMCVFYIV